MNEKKLVINIKGKVVLVMVSLLLFISMMIKCKLKTKGIICWNLNCKRYLLVNCTELGNKSE